MAHGQWRRRVSVFGTRREFWWTRKVGDVQFGPDRLGPHFLLWTAACAHTPVLRRFSGASVETFFLSL